MNIKEFIENKGYVCWKEDSEEKQYGTLESMKFQKRIKNDNIPVCNSNNRLFINIVYDKFTNAYTEELETCSIDIRAENQAKDWCDLKIYGIHVEKFKENIDYYENNLITMWEVFYDGIVGWNGA